MRIGQTQPQQNQPVKNDHNHNLTYSQTPTTSTQFFLQPNFFQEKHRNPNTTQIFFQNHPNWWFYHNFTTILRSSLVYFHPFYSACLFCTIKIKVSLWLPLYSSSLPSSHYSSDYHFQALKMVTQGVTIFQLCTIIRIC